MRWAAGFSVLFARNIWGLHPKESMAEQLEQLAQLDATHPAGPFDKENCIDHAPLSCTEPGCPPGGNVSCAQMADAGFCGLTFGKLYDEEVPHEVPGREVLVQSLCPASCHWCCVDMGPFPCEEEGCPDTGGGESLHHLHR